MTATFHAENSADQTSGLASYSITNTISTGDSLVVFGSWDQASTTTPTVVTTGGTGSDTLTLIYGPSTFSIFKYGAWLLKSAGAGRTGVTLSWASSNPSFADGSCISFSGLPNPTLDGSGFSGGACVTGPISSADTAVLLSDGEFAIGYAASRSAISAANSPWTDDGIIFDTGSWIEHRILTDTSVIHTNFTEDASFFPTGGFHITFCLTFMATPLYSLNSVW